MSAFADPNALNVAVSASLAVERVGMPEAQIILAEAATYVACAPKSNSSCEAVFAAMKTVGSVRTSVPPHLQDAHYKGSGKLYHGEGYQYAHDYPNHYVEQQYLPDEILGSRFLHLGTNGYEQKIRENFKKLEKTSNKRGRNHDRLAWKAVLFAGRLSEKDVPEKKCTSSRSTAG